MQLHQLEHLIRAAGAITDRYEFVVVGSQSILGSVERPPRECLMSNEADIYPKDAEELWDKIDGALGEGSQFHDAYGYYAQGVDSTTAVLPLGWEGRLKRLQPPVQTTASPIASTFWTCSCPNARPIARRTAIST